MERNGFFAYESALLVRPFSFGGLPLGLVEWNENDLWKREYATPPTKWLFFAEDVFGVQFCIGDGGVREFNPETGEATEICSSIEEWCRLIVENSRVKTGYPLAHAWQVGNGPIPVGQRLLPKRPFVLGGKYSVENLYALDEVEGMVFRASIANQIRDVPDGGTVVLKAVD
jgi:hypothetical protein